MKEFFVVTRKEDKTWYLSSNQWMTNPRYAVRYSSYEDAKEAIKVQGLGSLYGIEKLFEL